VSSYAIFNPILACVACLVTACILITSLIIVHNAYSPLPLMDSWSLWQLYKQNGSYLAFLFQQHNEHRIVVTRLVYIIDRFVFHGRSLFPLVCSLLLQVATGVWLYRIVRRTGEASRLSRLLLGCVICSALSSAQQFPNLVMGFQIQFTMVYCASCGSLLALMHAAEWCQEGRDAELWFAVSCVSAVVATYSSANGLLLWPVLLLFGLWLRLPFRFLSALLLDMVLVSMFYMRGYGTPSQHSSPFEALTQHPGRVLIVAAAFVGSPFDTIRAVLTVPFGAPSDNGRVAFAGACGVIGVCVLIWSGVLLWRRRDRYTRGHAALIHIAGFVVLTAVLVGLGRANFPLVAALDSRYATHGLVFWIAMGGFYWSFVERRLAALSAHWYQIAFSGVVLWMILGLAMRQPFWIRYSKDYANALNQIQAAIVSDVFDEPIWHASYPSGEAILGGADYLRQNHLSVFTEAWTTWVGKPVEGLFTLDPARSCIGVFESATPISSQIRPGWRVSGWAWDRLRQAGPGTVILVDPTQRIAGVVKNPIERGEVHLAIPEVRSSRVGWSGYVAGSAPRTLRAYLLESDGRSLCAFGTPLTLARGGEGKISTGNPGDQATVRLVQHGSSW
jgi:hypothetical protein